MEENTKKKKWNDDTFITEWIKKFDRSKYETVMCIVAAGMFLISACKLTAALLFHTWNERFWVQCVQILAVVGMLAMVIYFTNVYEFSLKQFGSKIRGLFVAYKWFFFAIFFVLWMFIGFFVNKCYSESLLMTESLFGTLRRNEGIVTRTLQLVLVVGLALVQDAKKKKRVVQLILIESVYLALPFLGQHWDWFAGITFLNKSEGFRYMEENGFRCSIFEHVNHYGYFLCMMILLSGGMVYLAKSWKGMLVYGAIFALNVMVLVINNTFGSWLASLIALVAVAALFVISKGKYMLKRCGLLFALFILVSTMAATEGNSMWGQVGKLASDMENVAADDEKADEAGSGRWGVWKIAGEYALEHPVFGGGEDCLIPVYAEAGEEILHRPANEYLQYAAFFGFPVLVAYLGILLIIFVQKVKNIRKAPDIILVLGGAVLAYAISSCFGNTTIYTTTDFFMLLGLVANCDKQKN